MRKFVNWKTFAGSALTGAVVLSLLLGLYFTSPHVSASQGYLSISLGSTIQTPAELSATITYPPEADTDREKLDALESLIQQYIDYFNEVGAQYRAQLIKDEQWYIFAHRPSWLGGNVFDQHLLPLLAERNELREKIRLEYCARNGIVWKGLPDEQMKVIMLDMYGDKALIRQTPTKATIDLLGKLKSVDISSLKGAVPPDPTEKLLTDYTLVDENDWIVGLTDDKVTWQNVQRGPDTDTLLYRDFGAEAELFDGDFEHLFETEVAPITSAGDATFIALANAVDDHYGLEVANEDVLSIYWNWSSEDMNLRECDGGAIYTDYDSLDDGVLYYGKWKRDEDVGDHGTLYSYAYDDSDRTNLVALQSLTLHSSKKDFRYFFAFMSSSYGSPSGDCDGYAQNYDLQEGAEPDITNTPATWAIGTVYPNTTYWSSGSEPSWPLTDGDAYFTVTNNSGFAVDIGISGTDHTGGVTVTLESTPGVNQITIIAFKEGDGSGDGITLTTEDQAFISNLAASADIDWELKFMSATEHTDTVGKTGTVTILATEHT